MKFDVQKIDERIKKLQELRRLATDPEIAGLLSEFVTLDEERTQLSEPPIPMPAKVEPIEMPGPETTNELVKEVVNGVAAPSNGGLWSRRRG
jgi:hypothetical protein